MALGEIHAHLALLNGWEWRFRSSRGTRYGMDSDSTITFLSGGRVELTECGYSIQSFDGIYAVDEKGVIGRALPRRLR
ncbi:MAG: hypothetical protein K9N23_12140 [Akkermansiaceae bacterium]|nr:hypothetical protein [Akkermansiaceae bacterium]